MTTNKTSSVGVVAVAALFAGVVFFARGPASLPISRADDQVTVLSQDETVLQEQHHSSAARVSGSGSVRPPVADDNTVSTGAIHAHTALPAATTTMIATSSAPTFTCDPAITDTVYPASMLPKPGPVLPLTDESGNEREHGFMPYVSPPPKCRIPLNRSVWAFWCDCQRGSFQATLAYAAGLRDCCGAELRLFICVSTDDGFREMIRTVAGEATDVWVTRGWTDVGLDEKLRSHGITHFYAHKGPGSDNKHKISRLPWVCNVMHYMFEGRNVGPEIGDVLGRISDVIPVDRHAYLPVIPYMVSRLPVTKTGASLRARLGIPPKALVFGRYGGSTTFDIPCVQRAVCEEAQRAGGTSYV